MHCDYFEDLFFVDDKLPAKQQKLRPSKICMYTVFLACGEN